MQQRSKRADTPEAQKMMMKFGPAGDAAVASALAMELGGGSVAVVFEALARPAVGLPLLDCSRPTAAGLPLLDATMSAGVVGDPAVTWVMCDAVAVPASEIVIAAARLTLGGALAVQVLLWRGLKLRAPVGAILAEEVRLAEEVPVVVGVVDAVSVELDVRD
jgi:hypothetical protein